MKKRYFILCGVCVIISMFFLIYQGTTYFMVLSKYFLGKEQYLQAYYIDFIVVGIIFRNIEIV